MPSNPLAIACLIAALCATAGCREHPRVTSRESLDLIKQVYTACNTRNPQRLERCQSAYEELVSQGTLSDREKRSFESILKQAQAGQWASAQSDSLQFAKDQVR